MIPSLRPWSPWLAPLVPELAAGLGPLVERLATALGPMPPRPDPGAVEPNGLAGIDRRGPYERLLLSEWAIADDLPDEFLRRAAAGEHLFLQVERTSERGGRRCVVLFDAGPDQLGGPRIAHLALLSVFARRAEEAGATLVHGPLQVGGAADADVTGHSYTRLLAARSNRRPEPTDHQDRASELDLDDHDEVWVVGGPLACRGASARVAHVLVREVLEAGPDQLEVEVRRPGRPVRVARLPLPPPDVRARLIRSPLQGEPPASPPRPHPRGPLAPEIRFSADGHRVLLRELDGYVVGLRVPADPQRKPRRMRLWDEPRDVLALGWAHRGLVVLRRSPKGTRLEGGRFHHEWPGPELPVPAASLELVASVVDRDQVVRFRDAEQRMWTWRLGSAPTATAGALAVGRRDGRLLTVIAGADRTIVTYHGREEALPFPGIRAHIGSGRRGTQGVVLVEGRDAWAFAGSETPRLHAPIAGVEVVGAFGDRTRRAVAFLSGGVLVARQLEPKPGPDLVLPADGPVLAAACSTEHYAEQVAWIERSGRVVLHDLRRSETHVLREAVG